MQNFIKNNKNSKNESTNKYTKMADEGNRSATKRAEKLCQNVYRKLENGDLARQKGTQRNGRVQVAAYGQINK